MGDKKFLLAEVGREGIPTVGKEEVLKNRPKTDQKDWYKQG